MVYLVIKTCNIKLTVSNTQEKQLLLNIPFKSSKSGKYIIFEHQRLIFTQYMHNKSILHITGIRNVYDIKNMKHLFQKCTNIFFKINIIMIKITYSNVIKKFLQNFVDYCKTICIHNISFDFSNIYIGKLNSIIIRNFKEKFTICVFRKSSLLFCNNIDAAKIAIVFLKNILMKYECLLKFLN